MSTHDLITLSSGCSFVTKNTEKNFRCTEIVCARFHGLLITQYVRNAFASCFITHTCNMTPAYKIIGGPDGGLFLFPHRRSLPERFVSPDDPFKSHVEAIRIAMTRPWRKTLRGRDVSSLDLRYLFCNSFYIFILQGMCSKIYNAALLLVSINYKIHDDEYVKYNFKENTISKRICFYMGNKKIILI